MVKLNSNPIIFRLIHIKDVEIPEKDIGADLVEDINEEYNSIIADTMNLARADEIAIEKQDGEKLLPGVRPCQNRRGETG